jgi:hypothetical protein
VKLRYTGPIPVSFPVLGFSVEPGDAFDAPDELVESLIARSDIEEVPEPEVEASPVRRVTQATPVAPAAQED